MSHLHRQHVRQPALGWAARSALVAVASAAALLLASAGTSAAATAPNSCVAGPGAPDARAAVSAGLAAENSTGVPHLITITAARSLWGWQDGGQLVGGVQTLQQEIDLLAGITLPGTNGTQAVPVHFATVPDFTPDTGSYPAGATSGNIYPSFALLGCLHTAYGSEVGMDYGGVYPNSLAGETATQIKQNTCDTQQRFRNHGFYRAWGAFAWANGQVSGTAVNIVSSCFSFGRAYGSGVNAVGNLLSSPYTIHTLSLNGGSCNASGLSCSSIFPRTYVMPGTITKALVQGSRVWTSVQFYHLLTGSRSSGNLTWDCTSPNPANHWTSRGEFYCADDLAGAIRQALSQMAPGSYRFVDPATGAVITGRGKPLGAS